MLVNWKSPYIEREVFKHYNTVRERQARAVLMECQGRPSRTGLAAILVEGLATLYVGGELAETLGDLSSWFFRMEGDPTTKHPNRFRHECVSGKVTNTYAFPPFHSPK